MANSLNTNLGLRVCEKKGKYLPLKDAKWICCIKSNYDLFSETMFDYVQFFYSHLFNLVYESLKFSWLKTKIENLISVVIKDIKVFLKTHYDYLSPGYSKISILNKLNKRFEHIVLMRTGNWLICIIYHTFVWITIYT